MNEQKIVQRCQSGDQEAFEELIHAYYSYVLSFLIKASGQKELAEDLTQDTFLKMIQNIDKFEISGKARFGTWLITIAKNTYLDHLRCTRYPSEDIDELQIAAKQSVSDTVIHNCQFEELMKMIETLPPEQGIAIKLKYLEDMTLNEIAERFSVPSKTIKSRIHDGTVKLRTKYKNKEKKELE